MVDACMRRAVTTLQAELHRPAPDDPGEAGVERAVADAQDVRAGQPRGHLCHLRGG